MIRQYCWHNTWSCTGKMTDDKTCTHYVQTFIAGANHVCSLYHARSYSKETPCNPLANLNLIAHCMLLQICISFSIPIFWREGKIFSSHKLVQLALRKVLHALLCGDIFIHEEVEWLQALPYLAGTFKKLHVNKTIGGLRHSNEIVHGCHSRFILLVQLPVRLIQPNSFQMYIQLKFLKVD